MKETFERLRREAHVIRWRHQQRPDGLNYSGSNKVLGIFLVNTAHLPFDYEGQSTTWQAEDPYLDITIPALRKSMLTPERGKASLNELARYIAFNGLHRRGELQVVGSTTHRPLAALAIRSFGFEIAHVSQDTLPQDDAAAALRIYDQFVNHHDPNGREAVFAFRRVDDLLADEAAKDPLVAQWMEEPPHPTERLIYYNVPEDQEAN